jgi:hypothetical protein
MRTARYPSSDEARYTGGQPLYTPVKPRPGLRRLEERFHSLRLSGWRRTAVRPMLTGYPSAIWATVCQKVG